MMTQTETVDEVVTEKQIEFARKMAKRAKVEIDWAMFKKLGKKEASKMIDEMIVIERAIKDGRKVLSLDKHTVQFNKEQKDKYPAQFAKQLEVNDAAFGLACKMVDTFLIRNNCFETLPDNYGYSKLVATVYSRHQAAKKAMQRGGSQ